MIEKSTILVSSTGRTGTEFFSKLFESIIPDCTSLHEPDIIKFSGVENKIWQFWEQLRLAGAWRMIFLKAVGKWTVARLSESRFLGTLNNEKAGLELYKQRAGFISNVKGSVYIESNLGYFGLIDILPAVFKNHKAVYIIRDGRDWVRSMMNWGEIYGKKGIRRFLSHKWPVASDIKGDAYASAWMNFSRFEKICWAWSRLNSFALDAIPRNPNARLFYFEDLFIGSERYKHLHELIHFVSDLPNIDVDRMGSTDGWLEQKIHKSSNQFPGWKDWNEDQKKQFRAICGPLMEKLNYTIK
jgi:hypothetical protein